MAVSSIVGSAPKFMKAWPENTTYNQKWGKCIMIESESGQGVPAKPVAPPSIERGLGLEALVSDLHSANAENVSHGFGPLRFRRKKADESKSAEVVPESKTAVGDAGTARRRLTWYWVAGPAVLLLIGGVVLGTTIPDPKMSGEYLALKSEKDGVNGQLSALQGRFESLAAGIKGREAAVSTREDAVSKADATVKAADAAVKQREQAVTAAEKTQAANTIKEGTWTVGVDIEPGTYRTTEAVTSSCYWGIYRTGSNGSDIIDNDIVSGGRPSVSLSAGQDFETTRCGDWVKQ